MIGSIERRACDLNEIVRQVIEEAESAHSGHRFRVQEASNATGSGRYFAFSDECPLNFRIVVPSSRP